jgi:adenylate kinase
MQDLYHLYAELYDGYKEFAEDTSVKEKIVRYSTQIMEVARKEGKIEGTLEMAKNL